MFDFDTFLLAAGIGDIWHWFNHNIMHFGDRLPELVEQYGILIYGILFLIIFCETGLVVTPILPGDSLLFMTGVVAAAGDLNVPILIVLLSIAAVLGDAVNYSIGAYLGPKVLSGSYPFLKKEYLDKTRDFYDRYGAKTIILARFVPIVRTFAPFLAGVGRMSYFNFGVYNITGGIAWITAFVLAGWLLGEIPFVKKNIEPITILIVIVSILPGVFEVWRNRRAGKRAESSASPASTGAPGSSDSSS